MTELVVHIGHGKAGSTSIQRTLDHAQTELRAQGIAYLGRTLEHCTAREPFSWQTPEGAARLLHAMPPDLAAAEIVEVLSAELSHLRGAGIERAIWSNEALFARHEPAIAGLTALRDAGHTVRVALYLRRHDHWAKSAYFQWGIRHKSYKGPVMGFEDWVAARPVGFAGPLGRWQEAFGQDLDLRNFHAVGDVVADFLRIAGARDIATITAYETPSPRVLAAWALYNSLSEEEQTPDRFARVLNALGFLGAEPTAPDLDALFPSSEDLERILDAAADDVDAVNAAFREKGVADFTDVPAPRGAAAPGQAELMAMTMQMVFRLQEQVLRLKRQVRDLEDGR